MEEEELDLTLSLQHGGSKKKPTPSLSLPPTNLSQTNPSTMDKQILPPILNPNPSHSLAFYPSNSLTFYPRSSLTFYHNPSIPFNHNPIIPFNPNPNPKFKPYLPPCCIHQNPTNTVAKPVENVSASAPSICRTRRPTSQRRSKCMNETVPAPFPWATNKQATIHSLKYLLEKNVHSITGKVQCKRCEKDFHLTLDLVEKVGELRTFIGKRKGTMHDRAPSAWVFPVLPKCPLCGRDNSVRPVLGNEKGINWLFLLLSQMLGCCTLDHLKYFCKYNNSHRTGAKDRLLYLTYMILTKQLLPEWFES